METEDSGRWGLRILRRLRMLQKYVGAFLRQSVTEKRDSVINQRFNGFRLPVQRTAGNYEW